MSGNGVVDIRLIERVNVGDILVRSAEAFGDRPAIIEADETLSYRGLEARANSLAAALIARGFERHEVVALIAGNRSEALVTYFACAKAGIIFAPMNLGLSPEEIAFCLSDCRARLLIIEANMFPLVSASLDRLPDLRDLVLLGEPDVAAANQAMSFDALIAEGEQKAEVEIATADRDPVQLLYTSGTTAHPKGVLTSHLAVSITALSGAYVHALRPGAPMLAVLPLFHCAQLNAGALPAVLAGAPLVLMRGFDAPAIADAIEQHRIAMVFLLPAMYAALLAEPDIEARDFSSVTRAMYAMAPMPEERLKSVRRLFPNADVVLGSGQTEFTPPTTYQRAEHQWDKAASWGPATPMVRTAIMDEEGTLRPRGSVGELVYRGPQVMNGYLNQPEQTAESMRHGWFHSGDVAWIDDEGVVWFTDRTKDIVKSGGENVSSVEVERALMEHPAVLEAAIVGVPHERWGEAVTAAVLLRDGHAVDEAALIAHCRARLGGFKVPKAVRFYDALPRTGTGKLQKHKLRAELAGLFAGDGASG